MNKRFGAVQALTDVDFKVEAGEVVALVGDNGAGKSTLIKTISGVGLADSGEVLFQGDPAHISGPQDATHMGIATVYQDLALADNLDVAGNLYLGRESYLPGGFFRKLRLLDDTGMEQKLGGTHPVAVVADPERDDAGRVALRVASARSSPSRGRCWVSRSS